MVNKHTIELSETLASQSQRGVQRLATVLLALSLFCALSLAAVADTLPELDCVIEPSEIVDIGSATAGVLEIISLDRGDPVRKNQVIAKLESGTEQAAAELARVRSNFDTGIQLRKTSAEFFNRNQERSRSLTEQNAISQQAQDQLDTEAIVAELQVRQEEDNRQLAKLEYRRARQALNRRTIKSPINGVVMERFRSVGEYVEDTAIMRVAQLDPLYVETIVPVSHMGQIKTGMQARVTPVVPGEPAEFATVTRIDRVADAASGTFGVRLEMANPNLDIVSGVRCAMEFTGKTLTAASTPSAPDPKPSAKTTATQTVSVSVESTAPRAEVGDLPQCFEAGPFANRSTASSIVEKLTRTGGEARLREVAGEHPGQFFVLTEKMSSETDVQNLVGQLKQKGVTDMHPLRRGIHAGHVSLGLFKSRESAEKKAEHYVAMGVAAHVSERSPTTLWLDITTAAAMDGNAVRKLMAADAPEQVSDVSCASLHSYVN